MIWVSAVSRDQAVAEVARVAVAMGVAPDNAPPEEQARRVVDHLNSTPSEQRLIVFDNVEDPDDLLGLVPHSDAAWVIVTSTNATTSLGPPVLVGMYTPEQSIDYLRARTGITDRAGAAAVATDLSHLPVAVTQAASAIVTLGYDFTTYRQALATAVLDQATVREGGDPYPERVERP